MWQIILNNKKFMTQAKYEIISLTCINLFLSLEKERVTIANCYVV